MRTMFVSSCMETPNEFITLRRKVEAKHGSLADAIRAGGVDPTSSVGKLIRRNIELKTAGTRPVRIWDLWALRGLLSMRKR